MRIKRYKVKGKRCKKDVYHRNMVGFSLIEMLVVVFVFSILGVVSTQILALSLRGSKKSESIGEVRANLEYAASTMERLLRNATLIDAGICLPAGSSELKYTDEHKDSTAYFKCDSSGGYIASGSSDLGRESNITSDSVIVDCTNVFTCPAAAPGVPQSVIINLTGVDAELGAGVEGSSVTVRTQIQLRNYE